MVKEGHHGACVNKLAVPPPHLGKSYRPPVSARSRAKTHHSPTPSPPTSSACPRSRRPVQPARATGTGVCCAPLAVHGEHNRRTSAGTAFKSIAAACAALATDQPRISRVRLKPPSSVLHQTERSDSNHRAAPAPDRCAPRGALGPIQASAREQIGTGVCWRPVHRRASGGFNASHWPFCGLCWPFLPGRCHTRLR